MWRIFRPLFYKKVSVIYSNAYLLGSADIQSQDHFDPKRHKKIRDQLIKDGLLSYKDFIKPPIITEEQLLLAHKPEYLRKLSDPVSVARMFGMQGASPWDTSLSEFFKYISGGTVWGALKLLREPDVPVFNLAGGFHHAHPDKAEGYCLINDVVVAIRCVRKRREKMRILVVDLDYHQGNGILKMLREDEYSFTFSIDAVRWIKKCTKDNNVMLKVEKGCGDEEYLTLLKSNLPDAVDRFKPEMIFYLAGADVFSEDSLGDLNITEDGMLQRDLFVYGMAEERGIPIISLPAGGYGGKSWIPFYRYIKSVIKKEKIYGN